MLLNTDQLLQEFLPTGLRRAINEVGYLVLRPLLSSLE
jgi:hypothetical protein